MAENLGRGNKGPVANPRGNTRNGRSKKTLKGDFGELPNGISVTAKAAVRRRCA